jgi:hypothetical protein
MTTTKVNPTFYTALNGVVSEPAPAPVNSSALLSDRDLVLERATRLLGYQEYLNQCRRFKARRESVSPRFEQEVQIQARQAISDGHELAASVLRISGHLQQAGKFDQLLTAWTAGVRAAGPVKAQDLWSDVVDDPQARQLLQDHGLTEPLFAALNETLKTQQGQFVLQGGKLAIELQPDRTEHIPPLVLAPSARGFPRSLSDLLRRGRFEQLVARFGQGKPSPFALVPGPARDLEVVEVIGAGTILGVQSLVQHQRKLEDTGLATLAGNELETVLAIAGLVSLIVGAILEHFCDDAGDGLACKIGKALILLGLLCLAIASFKVKDQELGVFFSVFFLVKILKTLGLRVDESGDAASFQEKSDA